MLLIADDLLHHVNVQERSNTSYQLPATWRLPTISNFEAKSESRIRTEFELLNITKEDKLTFQSVRVALDLANIVTSDEEIHSWLRETDIACKGYVDFSDYRRVCAGDTQTLSQSTSLLQSNNLLAIRKLFEQYDRNGDGFISKDDLHSALNSSYNGHGHVDDTAVNSWMNLIDTDRTGRISFEAFARRFLM